MDDKDSKSTETPETERRSACKHPALAREEVPVLGQAVAPTVCSLCGEQLSGEPIA